MKQNKEDREIRELTEKISNVIAGQNVHTALTALMNNFFGSVAYSKDIDMSDMDKATKLALNEELNQFLRSIADIFNEYKEEQEEDEECDDCDCENSACLEKEAEDAVKKAVSSLEDLIAHIKNLK